MDQFYVDTALSNLNTHYVGNTISKCTNGSNGSIYTTSSISNIVYGTSPNFSTGVSNFDCIYDKTLFVISNEAYGGDYRIEFVLSENTKFTPTI